MAEYTKPLPQPDATTQPFWDGCKDHKILAQKCSNCGRLRWPPAGFCPECHSWEASWVELAGTGAVAAFVVVIDPGVAFAFADQVPYTVAKIAMDGTDGHVILTSNVIDCPWEEVKVGMKVAVVYDDVTKDVSLPKFKPVG